MLFTDDGKVLGNTWSAGLFGDFFVGGVELLAGLTEDAAAEDMIGAVTGELVVDLDDDGDVAGDVTGELVVDMDDDGDVTGDVTGDGVRIVTILLL